MNLGSRCTFKSGGMTCCAMLLQASVQAWRGGKLSLMGRAELSVALLDDLTLSMHSVIGGCKVSVLCKHMAAAGSHANALDTVSMAADETNPAAATAASEDFAQPRACPQSPGTSLAIKCAPQSLLCSQCCDVFIHLLEESCGSKASSMQLHLASASCNGPN